MADEASRDAPPSSSVPFDPYAAPRRRMRRYLPPLPRYAIIASWGMLLAFATFYLLRKLGY